ncbi:10272_t:CDS:1, partial [Paraglomus occultum]
MSKELSERRGNSESGTFLYMLGSTCRMSIERMNGDVISNSPASLPKMAENTFCCQKTVEVLINKLFMC